MNKLNERLNLSMNCIGVAIGNKNITTQSKETRKEEQDNKKNRPV